MSQLCTVFEIRELKLKKNNKEFAITSPSFALILLVSEIAKYVYCLRLFIVVLQELHCLPNCLHVCIIRVRGAITLLLLVSEIAKCIT